MSPMTQAKILRILQEQTFERVGGNETIQADVRIIAATNAELEKLVASNRFRRDLYFRLNGFTIRLPTLRERGGDLLLLVDYYVRRFGRELGRSPPGMAPEVLEILQQYEWPGNVRELQSVLKQAMLQSPGGLLLADSLPSAVLAQPAVEAQVGGAFDWDRFVSERIDAQSENLYAEAVAIMDREVLLRVLRHTGGNQVQASRILGITRGSLRTKIKMLNIVIERSICSDDDQDD
jgi:two-component system response regulator AtoC